MPLPVSAGTWTESGVPGLKTDGWCKGCPFLMKSDFRTDDAADAAHKLVLKKIYCKWKVFICHRSLTNPELLDLHRVMKSVRRYIRQSPFDRCANVIMHRSFDLDCHRPLSELEEFGILVG